jgi:hypothetical protein
MKKKYTQLVPQNGVIPHIPLECHLEMLGVTLIQWCEEEHLEIPTSRKEGPTNPSAPLFAINATQDDFTDLSLSDSPLPYLIIGHTHIDAEKIDNAIAHLVCYVDSGARKSNYTKCEACGLSGHSIDKCFPLINFAIAQALAAQHPEVVRKIKSAYKQSPRTARSRTPRKATVKHIFAFLDLPTTEDIPLPVAPEDSAVSDLVTSLDIDDPNLFHCKVGSALITYRDQAWFSPPGESSVHTLDITHVPLGPCVIFSDEASPKHSVKSVHTQHDMLVDSGPPLRPWEATENCQHTSIHPHQASRYAQPQDK